MSKTIKDITATQTTLNADDYFELQENAGTSKKTMWSTFKSNLETYFDTLYYKTGANLTVYKQASYSILDNDNYGRVEVDTTAGAVTITLPLMANNIGRKITIAFVKNDASADVVTVSPHATDANKLSNDGLASIILPKVGNYVSLVQSSNSGFWEITAESITSQQRFRGYAGYGNASNNKIPYFTTVVENMGNMFTLTSNDNVTGIVFTINRSGKYSGDTTWALAANCDFGFSLNSANLTTNIDSLTEVICAGGCSTNSGHTGFSGIYFKKGDVLRLHTDGQAVIAARSFLNISYDGQ